ncbi:helix-turn-helix domain-containing protein [Halomicrococcus sp. NG-SE-24]|uniref:helix-turn-helix domain-containing protein n=1 Tax=Halomicrococcus sp. NG-SE-24 TaxID=3436928 RepID=UPI003D995E1B
MEYTPLQILLYEGYLPFGAFGELENGQMVFDLLVEDRESISEAVNLLREFGSVQVERITKDFQTHVVPSVTEWQNLLQSFSDRQREILDTAIEMGYYERPRETTLKELAEELELAKTTVSQHLRKAERRVVEFVAEYVNLAHSS